jgi:hypothetical protein
MTINFSLPRLTGRRSFYVVTGATGKKSALARVSESALSGRRCGDTAGPLAAIPHHSHTSNPLLRTLTGAPPPTAPSVTLREVKIAAIADFQYFSEAGANSTTVSNRIAALMNSVSAIYERDLGVTITLSTIYLHPSAGDPYTTDDAEQLLVKIANNKATYGSADIYHLLTGRNIYGLIGGNPNYSVVGLAYLAQACTESGFPYSVSEKLSDTLDYLIIAHELGHNFGANHDQFQTSPSTIMFPSLPPAVRRCRSPHPNPCAASFRVLTGSDSGGHPHPRTHQHTDCHSYCNTYHPAANCGALWHSQWARHSPVYGLYYRGALH